MKSRSRSWAVLVQCLFVIGVLCFSGHAEASCRNPNLVQEDQPFAVPAAASGFLEVKWFGHSFFQITSSRGTKIITDPFGAMGFPMPEVWPDVVTIGREHGNHNNAGLAKGSPIVLRGLKERSLEWNDINLTFRDVLIYNVPVHQRGYPGYEGSLKGSAFVFELDGLCILHSGDISEPFNEDQLQLIGHIDILLVVIGGSFTAGPDEAKQIVRQLKPKIVVPMHFWYRMNVIERFTEGPYPARFIDGNVFSVSKDTLPGSTEIYVLKVKSVREGEQ